jgi:thiol-disulfide isomerase/thioredoxin/Tfp pilus assembly protein PilF
MSTRNRVVVVVCWFAIASLQQPAWAQSSETKQDPAFIEQFEKGKEGLKNRKYDDAIAAFKKANKAVDNRSADCLFGMALAYARKGDADHALEFADKSIAMGGDDLGHALVHNLKGEILLALGQTENKKLKAAEDEFRQAAELDKNSALFRFNLGKALASQSKDDDARRELETCLTLKPDETMARDAKLMMADPRRARVEFAPDFQLTTLQGQPFSLAQASGRVLVMDFWATWCPPCRESVPELKDLTKKYPADKLILVSVSADSNDQSWREFVAKKKMDWMQYRDTDHKVLLAFGIHAFPTYLVITGDGIIKQRIVGMNPQQTIVHRLKETLQSMPELEGELPK